MSKIYKTLNKKGDPETLVYPNIEAENIPSDSIDKSKLVQSLRTLLDYLESINDIDNNRLIINEIIADIGNFYRIEVDTPSVFSGINNNGSLAVSGASTFNGSVDFNEIPSCNNTETYLVYITLSPFNLNVLSKVDLSSYTQSDINNALNFNNKNQASDFTPTDINVLGDIIDGLIEVRYGYYTGSKKYTLTIDNLDFTLSSENNIAELSIIDTDDASNVFMLKIDLSSHTIIEFEKYINGQLNLVPIKVLS